MRSRGASATGPVSGSAMSRVPNGPPPSTSTCTPRGTTTPEEAKTVAMKPIGRMPVRSFIIWPDGETPLVEKLPVTIRGIAFSGFGAVEKVEWSSDDGQSWLPATLGESLGPHAFRPWEAVFSPSAPGRSRVRDTNRARQR